MITSVRQKIKEAKKMNDIDCISYEISCAANALGAVHDAMRT